MKVPLRRAHPQGMRTQQKLQLQKSLFVGCEHTETGMGCYCQVFVGKEKEGLSQDVLNR